MSDRTYPDPAEPAATPEQGRQAAQRWMRNPATVEQLENLATYLGVLDGPGGTTPVAAAGEVNAARCQSHRVYYEMMPNHNGRADLADRFWEAVAGTARPGDGFVNGFLLKAAETWRANRDEVLRPAA